MKESALNMKVAERFLTWDRQGFFQRIESNSTGDGIPDIYLVSHGKSVWIESKIANIDANRNVSVDVRNSQRAWHKRHYRAGGHSWFLIGVPAKRGLDGIALVPGFCVDELWHKMNTLEGWAYNKWLLSNDIKGWTTVWTRIFIF